MVSVDIYNIPASIIKKQIIAKTSNTAQAITNSLILELSPFGSWWSEWTVMTSCSATSSHSSFLYRYYSIKKGARRLPCARCGFGSHQVLNSYTSVVAVAVDSQATQTLSGSFCEGVCYDTIAGLEADLGLEGVLPNGANHLEGNIRTIEQTSVIR